MKNIKKYLTMVLTVAMVIGSLSVVVAGSDSGNIYVTPSCTAYCDVWCDEFSSTASTWLYLDIGYNSNSYSAYVSLEVTAGRELDYEVLGTDSCLASSASDSRAIADAEVSYSEVPYRAESYHEASVGVSSDNIELTASFD